MNALTARLAARIVEHGPLPFADFMAEALYDPEHGYYASGRAAIGRGGDYFTNVSVGPLFGRLLMRQFAEMWRRLGQPANFTIVEQGAHAGDFAHDVLEGAQRLEPAFSEALRYVIVEPLAAPEKAQRTRLASFAGRIDWAATPGGLALFDGVHFSNELIDAFPVHAIRFVKGAWLERKVAWQDERFVWTDAPVSNEALLAHVATLPQDLPDGYLTEANLLAGPWLYEVAGRLRRGWVLAIDYGYPRTEYYRRERNGGTLSAYAQHRRVDDQLSAPGEVDLTAHVDFTTLAEAARGAGLHPAGFADQHHFMVGLARLHFSDASEITSALEKETRAFKTLMHPNLMGSSFKAICFGRELSGEPLSGFSFGNSNSPLII